MKVPTREHPNFIFRGSLMRNNKQLYLSSIKIIGPDLEMAKHSPEVSGCHVLKAGKVHNGGK
jgi:hypothetical protein